jgi:hypothetical protein
MISLPFRKIALILWTSLVVVLCPKLVLACRTLDGSSSLEAAESTVQFYFLLSFISFVANSFLYLMYKRRGLTVLTASFIILFTFTIIRFNSGMSDCGTFKAESAKWLFGLSILCVLFQIAAYRKR